MNIEERIHKLREPIIMREGPHAKIDLYVGMNEWADFQEIARHHLMRHDPKLVGQRAQYRGMDIYRVDAESHLTAHLVEP